MNILDQFAIVAMPAVMVDEVTAKEAARAIGVPINEFSTETHWPKYVAVMSYRLAQAMVDERLRLENLNRPQIGAYRMIEDHP